MDSLHTNTVLVQEKYNKSLYLAKLEFYSEATVGLKELLIKEPKFVDAYILLGKINMNMLNFKEALKYFRVASCYKKSDSCYKKCLYLCNVSNTISKVIIAFMLLLVFYIFKYIQ